MSKIDADGTNRSRITQTDSHGVGVIAENVIEIDGTVDVAAIVEKHSPQRFHNPKREAKLRVHDEQLPSPKGTVTFTHPDCPFKTLQKGTTRCGPASSTGKPRSEVPPPEKKSWLVGTKLPANDLAIPIRMLLANTSDPHWFVEGVLGKELAKTRA